MKKLFADLDDSDGNPVIVMIDKITHLTVDGPKISEIHFVSGKVHRVMGTVSEITAKLWPMD